MNNFVVVSGGQQRDSAIHIHVSNLPQCPEILRHFSGPMVTTGEMLWKWPNSSKTVTNSSCYVLSPSESQNIQIQLLLVPRITVKEGDVISSTWQVGKLWLGEMKCSLEATCRKWQSQDMTSDFFSFSVCVLCTKLVQWSKNAWVPAILPLSSGTGSVVLQDEWASLRQLWLTRWLLRMP